MGHEIIRRSDFVIYDSKFNVVELPRDSLDYGVRGETIDLEYAAQDVTTERVGARTHVREVKPGDREITLTLQIFGKTRHDYEIKERALSRFFRSLGQFYIAKGTASKILYKVILDGKISLSKVNYIIPYAQATVKLKKIEIDYGISHFTTLDLHNKKVRFDGSWSFGMNLKGMATSDNTKYIFSENEPIKFYNGSDVPFKNISNPFFKVVIRIKTATLKLTLYDDYGNAFIYNNKGVEADALKSGDVLVLNGVNVELNGRNVLNKTNKRFLKTNTDINKWRILEDFNYEIEFDFRYIYE